MNPSMELDSAIPGSDAPDKRRGKGTLHMPGTYPGKGRCMKAAARYNASYADREL